ncbi:MAG TPA: ABC transporter ATP-binding protein [Actinomycetota bacterium]|jgi:putative ABC transport system ATP-binding protein
MSASVGLDVTADEERELPVPEELRSAWAVLRRGLRESPELRRGLWFTVIVSLGVTVSELVTPVLVQQVFDHGFTPEFDPAFVIERCAAAFALVVLSFVAARAAGRRLVQAAELALKNLRVRTFEHIHELSIAEQSEEKRGVFVARVTADVDALQQFMEWGGIAWIISFTLAAGALGLMLVYSWELSLAVLVLLIPLVLVVWAMQSRLSAAFNTARTRVGEMLSEVSESVMGAAVVRAYGLDERRHERVQRAITERYRAEVVAHFRAATLWPVSSVFYGLSLAVVIVLGSFEGPSWGLTFGQVTAFLFLADVFLHVFTDLPEIYSETQTAIAGWRKILAVLDLPVEVVEPSPGAELPRGALSVDAEDVRFRYRAGPIVLRGVSLSIAAGSHVAIVGETGCGKTTFVKLMCRLADPIEGVIRVGGVDLREAAPRGRRRGIRMVPQDGFLFDTTVRENVRYGREGAGDRDVETAIEELGLGEWVAGLTEGLDTKVGERGEALSVGERQLVALARAQLGDPGLLILDEATSAVDPASERRITEALRRVSAGRTTVTVAHRLSTAEAADHVFVFDAGRLVQEGTHASLVAEPGVYARLYRSWLGNVGQDADASTA